MLASIISSLTTTSNAKFNKIANTLIKKPFVQLLGDLAMQYTTYNRTLTMPLSHDLPFYKSIYKYYDTLLPRVSKYLRKEEKNIRYIDIGANIGDTLASVYSSDPKDFYLAVEPNSNYFRYLTKNFGFEKNVLLKKVLCTSQKSKDYKIVEKNGTAQVIKEHSQKSVEIETYTLDELVKLYCIDKKINLIKVDTDGYDLEIIKSGLKSIKTYQPFLLFECDRFSNIEYEKDVENVWALLSNCGYKNILVYDNTGYLLGVFPTNEFFFIKELLQYQQERKTFYYDMLAVPRNQQDFINKEKSLRYKIIKANYKNN